VKIYIVLIRPPRDSIMAAYVAGVYANHAAAKNEVESILDNEDMQTEEEKMAEALIYHAQVFPRTENDGIVACERYE